MQHDDVIVIDDAISPEAQDYLEETLLSPNFAWLYNHQQVDSKFYEDFNLEMGEDYCNTPQFVHAFFANQQLNSDYFVPVVMPVLSGLPYTVDILLRAKANMTLQNNGDQKAKYGAIHVDAPAFDEKHQDKALIGIYYVNDSDGDTVIFNETAEDINKKKLTVKATVSPKKGRLVIFNGRLLHAGNNPKETFNRLVINLNFVPYT